jgi:hypothetical protein
MAKYCGKCDDTGQVPISEILPDYRGSETESEYITCPICGGSSREKRLRELETMTQTPIKLRR